MPGAVGAVVAARYNAKHKRGKKQWKRDDWVDPKHSKLADHKKADAKHQLDHEKADKLWLAFCNLDTNHDGHIDRNELKTLYMDSVDDEELHATVEQVMDKYDLNGDG